VRSPHSGDAGPPPLLDALELDQATPLERAERRVVAVRGPHDHGRGLRAVHQMLERRALARAQSLAALQRGRPGLGQRGREREAHADARQPARARSGRKHQRQPARGRGAVLLAHPQAQADQLGRDAVLEGGERLDKPIGGQLALLGQPDHHAEEPPPAEWNDQHRADVDLGHLPRQPVVERPPQRARRGQWLHLCDHASRR